MVPTATPALASSTTPADAIKSLIARANDDQQQAFAQHDDTLMRDTATSAYYEELVKINSDLTQGGVTGIKLLGMDFGPITMTSPTAAEATTTETWQTTFANGTHQESQDRNVYTLTQVAGAWKIQADSHPDSSVDQVPTVTAPSTAGQPPSPSTPSTIARPGQSRNWAGYSATNGTFSAVSGTWIVPHPSPTGAFGVDATWVGIGGEQSRDLIQAGTETDVSGTGQAQYQAWIELLPQASHPVPLEVSPGDNVTISIKLQQAPDQWHIAIANDTTGKRYETTVTYASSQSSAEWIEEAPSSGRRLIPLDDFGIVRFTNGSAVKDGKQVTLSQAGARPVTMINANGDPVATPSALDITGAGFSVTRNTPAPSQQPVPPQRRRATQ